MKARSAVYLNNGDVVRLRETYEQARAKLQTMAHSQPGTAFEYTRVTGHGSLKRVVFPIGLIVRIEEL